MRKFLGVALLFLACCSSAFAQSASKTTTVTHPAAGQVRITSTIAPGSLPGTGMSHTLTVHLTVRKPNGTILADKTAAAINNTASVLADVFLNDDLTDLGIYSYTTNWTVFCTVGKYTSSS